MRGDHISIFLIISMVTAPFNGAAPSNCPNSSTWQLNNRRILHQPLFPIDSPPPPPPPPIPDIPEGQPFSNELPAGPTFDESYQPPPPPLPEMGTAVATSTAANPHAMKKLVIAALSTAVTVGMLLAMAFFLYKNRGKRHDESQKLVDENSQRIDEERRVPPPPFLCIEAAEPSTSGLVDEEAHINIVSSSPYQKLKPKPRPKPPPPPRMSSPPPPPMSSSGSDDETRNHNESDNLGSRPIPHSKRTPPKSRFSTSSPDTRPSPPHSTKLLPFPPSRTKFSASPPSPATGQLLSMSSYEHKPSKIPIPPPPPPPPPPSMATKHGAAKKYTPVFKQKRRGQSKSPSPKASPSSNRTRPVNKGLLQSPEESRPRMKPLHWDKVGATADGATVWDHLKSTSFQLNEGAMESLFGCNSVTSVPRETTRKFVLPSVQLENRILDSKKSQNIAILLRALNVTREEVSEALHDGNPEGLGPELFETLVKMAPSKEEEKKLREYNDDISRLGPAERFLKAILDIPFAFKRVEALLYKENFNTEVKYLRKSFQTLEEASEELKNSRLFLKLLEAVLRTGNHMNGGTNRGDAKAFKLDTLLKLVDIKGKDGKTTLLHFVVQEVIRSEGAGYTSESQSQKSNSKFNEEDFKKEGLQVVAGLSKELGNVKKAAGMDSDVLSSYVSKLELGLQTVRQVLQFENHISQDKFVDSIKVFLEEAVDEISRIKAEERKALSLVKEVTQYFHGDDAKREAHPLRIFTVIRDFLSILDNVCKDVGRMQERSTMGSGRSFRLPAAMALPVLTRYNTHNDRSSDDDSM